MYDLLVANYNNAKYIDQFIKSIINSTIKPNKVIFVDDCSTDESLSVLSLSLKGTSLNVEVIRNDVNKGFAWSLNKGLEYVESEFIARVDPDDYVASERFEKQLSFLRKNPQFDLVGSNVYYVRNKKVISHSNVPLDSGEISTKIRSGQLPMIHGSVMFRALSLDQFRYKAELVPAEDYDLFAFFVVKNARLVNLSEPLTYVTIHANSVSNSLKFNTIVKRYNICYNYFGKWKWWVQRYFEYLHQKNYRRYLFYQNNTKYLFLIISVIFNPIKLLKRVRL